MFVAGCAKVASAVSDSLRPPWTAGCQDPLSTDSPGKETGVVFCVLLQGIFPPQGSLRLVSLALAGGFFYHYHHLGSSLIAG